MQAEALFNQIGVEGTDFKILASILQKKEFSEEDYKIISEFSWAIAKQFCFCNMYADCIVREVMVLKKALTKYYSTIASYFKIHPDTTIISLYTTGNTEFEETGEYVRIYMLRKPDDSNTLYLKFEHIVAEDFDGRLMFEPYLM